MHAKFTKKSGLQLNPTTFSLLRSCVAGVGTASRIVGFQNIAWISSQIDIITQPRPILLSDAWVGLTVDSTARWYMNEWRLGCRSFVSLLEIDLSISIQASFQEEKVSINLTRWKMLFLWETFCQKILKKTGVKKSSFWTKKLDAQNCSFWVLIGLSV